MKSLNTALVREVATDLFIAWQRRGQQPGSLPMTPEQMNAQAMADIAGSINLAKAFVSKLDKELPEDEEETNEEDVDAEESSQLTDEETEPSARETGILPAKSVIKPRFTKKR